MTRLLLDQGIPLSSAAHLCAGGFDAVHVRSLGMSQSPDWLILDRAKMEQRTVVTLDADFHTLLAVNNHAKPSVIRIRREGLRGAELAALLIHIWPTIQAQIATGAMVTITEKTIRTRSLPILKE